MAGANCAALVIAAAEAGGLGSLPCAMLSADVMRAEIGIIQQRTSQPFNLNFFCHQPAPPDPDRAAAWKDHLAGYYDELGLDKGATAPSPNRAPFDDAMCAMCSIVEDTRPAIVSFISDCPNRACWTGSRRRVRW